MAADCDRLWESVIQQTESALLAPDTHAEASATRAAAARKADGSAEPQIMSARDIGVFIEATAQSHGCDPSDIMYYYDPVIGDDGRVVLDELFLVFNMKSLSDGVLLDRAIHTIRVVVPQEVQQRARAMMRAQEADAEVARAEAIPAGTPPKKTRARRKPAAARKQSEKK